MTSQASRLESLPAELVQWIAECMRPRDLAVFRSTNRTIQHKSRAVWLDRYFKKLFITTVPKDPDTLLTLLQEHGVGNRVKQSTFTDRSYPIVLSEAEGQRILARLDDMLARMPNIISFRICHSDVFDGAFIENRYPPIRPIALSSCQQLRSLCIDGYAYLQQDLISLLQAVSSTVEVLHLEKVSITGEWQIIFEFARDSMTLKRFFVQTVHYYNATAVPQQQAVFPPHDALRSAPIRMTFRIPGRGIEYYSFSGTKIMVGIEGVQQGIDKMLEMMYPGPDA